MDFVTGLFSYEVIEVDDEEIPVSRALLLIFLIALGIYISRKSSCRQIPIPASKCEARGRRRISFNPTLHPCATSFPKSRSNAPIPSDK